MANSTGGAQTIWLPAWTFRLTLDDTGDVSVGDLDVTEDLTIRGIELLTTVDATEITDAAFEVSTGVTLNFDEVIVID